MEPVQDATQVHDVLGIGTVRWQLVHQGPVHAREVVDLDVRARHARHGVLAAHQIRDDRVDRRLLFLLVLRQPLHDEPAHRLELGARLLEGHRAEPVGDAPDPLQLRSELQVLSSEPLRHVGRGMRFRPAAAPTERAQRVQDRGDVDELLHDRATDRPDDPERPEEHEPEREPHPHHDTLDGDAAGALRDRDRVGEPVEPVHDQHHVGGLGGGRRASGAHRHAHIGGRERGRVVQAVADHDDDAALAAFDLDGLDLLIGRALGQDPVDAERSAHGLGDVGMVARHHDHAPDPGAPQGPDHPRRVGPDRVVDHQGAGDFAVDRHEDARRTVEHRATPHVPRARWQRAPAGRERRLSEGDPMIADAAFDAGAVLLAHPVGEDQFEVAIPGRADDRAGQHVGRHLVERGREVQQALGLDRPERLDVGDLRDPRGERAGLVEQQD